MNFPGRKDYDYGWLNHLLTLAYDRQLRSQPPLDLAFPSHSLDEALAMLLPPEEWQTLAEQALRTDPHWRVDQGWLITRLQQSQFKALAHLLLRFIPGTLSSSPTYPPLWLLQGLRTSQIAAVKAAGSAQRLFLLLGGPGSGKTFIAGRILLLWALRAAKPLRIALLAPTGKAALKLGGSIQGTLLGMKDHLPFPCISEVMTLHRLIHSGERLGGYSENTIPAPFDLLVVDELSMVDQELLGRFLTTLAPSQSQLLLLGDPYQLPPVQGWNILNELNAFLIKTPTAPVAVLRESVRSANPSLNKIAEAAKASEEHELEFALQQEGTCWSQFEQMEELAYEQLLHFPHPSSLEEALALLGRSSLLCTCHDGPWGKATLNEELYIHYRHHLLQGSQMTLYLPVMVETNQADLESVNGQMGIVPIPRKELLQAKTLPKALETAHTVYIEQPPPTPPLPVARVRLRSLSAAWAMTVHKAQGSEFDQVTVLIGEGPCSRSLFYTAVTRAKQSLHLITLKRPLSALLQEEEKRYSPLYNYLVEAWQATH